jgi:hypothetical protein
VLNKALKNLKKSPVYNISKANARQIFVANFYKFSKAVFNRGKNVQYISPFLLQN